VNLRSHATSNPQQSLVLRTYTSYTQSRSKAGGTSSRYARPPRFARCGNQSPATLRSCSWATPANQGGLALRYDVPRGLAGPPKPDAKACGGPTPTRFCLWLRLPPAESAAPFGRWGNRVPPGQTSSALASPFASWLAGSPRIAVWPGIGTGLRPAKTYASPKWFTHSGHSSA